MLSNGNFHVRSFNEQNQDVLLISKEKSRTCPKQRYKESYIFNW